MSKTLSLGNVSTRLEWIAEMSRKHPERVFTSLSHLIDMEWMQEAYRRTRKDGAPGVDDASASEFAAELSTNLELLVQSFHSGDYVAPPVRRVEIPKDNGKTRPIGIPTFADKVLQRAVAMLLEALYEPHFHADSYGFRPGRSAHQASGLLQKLPTYWEFCWVIEADIEGFFDAIDHGKLREVLDRRVRDGAVRRVIDKWLNVGVVIGGRRHSTPAGTPQGGVISPLLANIYLDAVLDGWFEKDVRPRMRGRTRLVRYADDFVMLFGYESDARRVYDVLPKRFARFGLTLHALKTKLLPFSSPNVKLSAVRPPQTFTFLGFLHYWAKSRKGRYIVKRRTSKERFTRALRRLKDRCIAMRHWCLSDQHRVICQMIRGHCSYFGITGNGDCVSTFRSEAIRIWGRALSRRHRRRFTWKWFLPILGRFPVPLARPVHSTCPSEPSI